MRRDNFRMAICKYCIGIELCNYHKNFMIFWRRFSANTLMSMMNMLALSFATFCLSSTTCQSIIKLLHVQGFGYAKLHLRCGQARLLLPGLKVLVSVGCEILL